MTLKFNHAKNNWEAQAQAKESFRQDVAQRDQTVRELTEENQALFRRVQDLEDQLASLSSRAAASSACFWVRSIYSITSCRLNPDSALRKMWLSMAASPYSCVVFHFTTDSRR